MNTSLVSDTAFTCAQRNFNQNLDDEKEIDHLNYPQFKYNYKAIDGANFNECSNCESKHINRFSPYKDSSIELYKSNNPVDSYSFKNNEEMHISRNIYSPSNFKSKRYYVFMKN